TMFRVSCWSRPSPGWACRKPVSFCSSTSPLLRMSWKRSSEDCGVDMDGRLRVSNGPLRPPNPFKCAGPEWARGAVVCGPGYSRIGVGAAPPPGGVTAIIPYECAPARTWRTEFPAELNLFEPVKTACGLAPWGAKPQAPNSGLLRHEE